MLLSEKLYSHLLEIDETAQNRLEQMIPPVSYTHLDVYKRQLLNCMEGEKEDGCQDAVESLLEDAVRNTHRHEEMCIRDRHKSYWSGRDAAWDGSQLL